MPRSLTVAALVVFACVSAPVVGTEPTTDSRFLSPGGKYELMFEEIARRTFTREEQLQRLDNTDHIEYEVTIIRIDTGTPVATFPYSDVYGFNQPSEPTPLKSVSRWFDWSPEEDFVVLPVEGWASAPGTPEAKVLALNDELGWSESWFTLDEVTWADALVAVGDRHNDCDYSVDVFDGRIGKQRAVVEKTSPIGYQIESVSARQMLIRRVLDNCARTERRETFEQQCLSLDLDTMTVSPEPCGS
jgi:hypothetical protein